MRHKRAPASKTSFASTSMAKRESQIEYDHIKAKNTELSKEVAELRKNKTTMLQDIDYLIKQKFVLECKYNQLSQVILNINESSRICLTKIVECSSELTQIMKLTHAVQDQFTNGLPSMNTERKSTSFKQVVTPHAVNGHVIHSPTIRITRFNDPRVKAAETASPLSTDENNVNETLWNNVDRTENREELEGNQQEEEVSDLSFESRGRRRVPVSRLSDFEVEENVEEEEMDERQSSDEEQNDRLPVIEEDPMEEELEETIVRNNRVNSDRRRKAACTNDSTTRLNLSIRDESHQESFNSSINVEASTSFNRTMMVNEELEQKFGDQVLSRNGDSPMTKRSSFIERKSLGSPFPQRASHTRSKSRYSVNSPTSVASCSSTLRSRNALGLETPSKSNLTTGDHSDESMGDLDLSNTSSAFIENTYTNSTPLVDQVTETKRESITPHIRKNVTARGRYNSNPLVGQVTETKRESITPQIRKNVASRGRSRDNTMNPSVQLIRHQFDEKGPGLATVRSSSVSSKKNVLLSESQIKTEKLGSKKSLRAAVFPSPSRESMKRTISPARGSSGSSSSPKRPRRAAKPMTLKEPCLNKKMRRSR